MHFTISCVILTILTQVKSDIDECQSSPCLHNGKCIDALNGFTCNCTEGFTGATCEIVSAVTWYNHRGVQYYVSPDTDDGFTFRDSRARCRAHGGDLAIINDRRTHRWITNQILPASGTHEDCSSTRWFWIGLLKQSGVACSKCRDGWKWVDGSSPDHQWWNEVQPEADERFCYLGVCYTSRYEWFSAYETDTRRYICSRVAVTWYQHLGIEYSISAERYSWNVSRDICRGRLGDLAIIKDNNTLNWLISTVLPRLPANPENHCERQHYFWVGLIKEGDSWKWLDGSNVMAGTLTDQQRLVGDRYGQLVACYSPGYELSAGWQHDKHYHICSRVNCELFVGDDVGAAHYLLDTSTGVTTRLPFTGLVYLAACTSDRRVFFTDHDVSVRVYDTTGSQSTQVYRFSGYTYGVCVDEQLQRVFVSVGEVGIQSVTFAGDGVKTITSPVGFSVGLATDATNRMLYFTTVGLRTLERISYEDLDNPTDHTVIKTGFPGYATGVVLDKPGDRIYVILHRGAIWSFKLSTDEEIGEIISAPSANTQAYSLVMCDNKLLYTDVKADNVWRIGRDETDGNDRVKVNNQQLGHRPSGMCRL